jgi:predicted DsbA family dithiol-disulfide isomerase
VTPLRVRVHYDFASTLCYVAHKVMGSMAPELARLELELTWSPLDLARLAPFRRGEPVPEVRLENAARVARELGVEASPPRLWPDSRRWNAAALLAERAGVEPIWRERVWTALFEQPQRSLGPEATLQLARELGLDPAPEELEKAALELEVRTERARDEQVTGVPTFMLGSWPFGGIQTVETMRQVLERFAGKQRAGQLG